MHSSYKIVFVTETDLYHANATFNAANNVDSSGKGPWPEGVFSVQTLIRVTGEDSEENGKYGKWFVRANKFMDVDDEERTGMGIHAGRKNKTDLRGRYGVQHATMGCIRTTPEAMQYIADHWDNDKLTKIVVIN